MVRRDRVVKKVDDIVSLLRVRLSSRNLVEVMGYFDDFFTSRQSKKQMIVFTPNAEQLVMAQHDDIFSSILNRSTLNIVDGIGLVLADRWISAFRGMRWEIRSKVAGVDLMESICLKALESGKKVFLLGGRNRVGQRVAETLLLKYRNQRTEIRKQKSENGDQKIESRKQELIDWFGGAKDVAHETVEENRETMQKINEYGAEVLFVGYGAPYQEKWVVDNLSKLKTVRLAMVVGGAMDIIAGRIKRAPVIWQRMGLEWLWRLLHEPWRWKRQLRLFEFWWLVMREAWRGRDQETVTN